jgi:Ca2+/Na+ antiporter
MNVGEYFTIGVVALVLLGLVGYMSYWTYKAISHIRADDDPSDISDHAVITVFLWILFAGVVLAIGLGWLLYTAASIAGIVHTPS